MRFLLPVFLFLTVPAFATCGDEVSLPEFSYRVREMQVLIRDLVRSQDGRSNAQGNFLEILETMRAEALRRVFDLPEPDRRPALKRLVATRAEASPDEILRLAGALAYTTVKLRRHLKPDLGGIPGGLVGLVKMMGVARASEIEVRPLDAETLEYASYVIEPLDEAAFGVAIETASKLRPGITALSACFESGFLEDRQIAWRVSGALVASHWEPGRLHDLVRTLPALWINPSADDFREISNTLGELYTYVEIADYLTRFDRAVEGRNAPPKPR